MSNYYEELNIATNATQEEISKAYKYLARKYHPDLYTGDKEIGRKKMAVVNEAYAVLSDPAERETYDMQNNFNQPAKTYYEELEVSGAASTEEIHLAYKKLARQYHPDLYKGDKDIGAKKMSAINNAYDTLSDKEKREKYDRKLSGNYAVDKPKKKFPVVAVIAAVMVIVIGAVLAIILLGNKSEEIPEFTLTYNTDDNCTITGANIQTVRKGISGTPITVHPDEGYAFVAWSDGITENPRTDIPQTEAITVTAICREGYSVAYSAGTTGRIEGTWTITISWEGSAITATDTIKSTPQKIAKGATITVTAVPNEGYELSNWSDGKTTSATRTDTVNGAISVTANFRVKTYTINFVSTSGGKLQPELGASSSDYVFPSWTHGVTLTLTAVADSGYEFVCWKDTQTNAIISTNPEWSGPVTSNLNITAVFALIPE